MKPQNTLLALTMLTALTAPSVSHADNWDTRQVWRDTGGQIVHNTWGNCVRSIWENGVDVCAPPPAVITYNPPPPPPPRTIIAEAARTVYFPFNVATLTPEAQQHLDSLAQRINSASDVKDAQVVGYADRIGTISYNEALSKMRAENVRDYLIGRGVMTENQTMTRWVGESESKTQCPANISHQQLIECLAPDRKVTVELKYKTQEEMQPQTNAAPYTQSYPQDQSGQFTTGQNPQDWTGQAQSPSGAPNQNLSGQVQSLSNGDNATAQNNVIPESPDQSPSGQSHPYSDNSGAIAEHEYQQQYPPSDHPMEQYQLQSQQQPQSQAAPNQTPSATSNAAPEEDQTNAAPAIAAPVRAETNITPDQMQSDSGMIGTSGQSMKPSVETYPAPQPTVDQQNTDAKPYMGQPPLTPVAESHPSVLPHYADADPPQPSDAYRYRYLTTGE